MKNVLIVILASLSLTSCSVMKKHKTETRSKLDSTAIIHKDVAIKEDTKTSTHDTNVVVKSKTVTHDMDTTILVPGHEDVATLVAGNTNDETIISPTTGDTINVHVNKDKSTTVRVSTPASHIPIRLHDVTREVDTTTAVNSGSATQEAKINEILGVTTKVTAKDDKSVKTKDKTVFSFPWYVWLIAALVGIVFLVWRYRKTIITWFV